FAVRENAMKELATLGLAAEAALRKARAGSSSVDVRLRAGVLLRKLESPDAVSQRLRNLRALEALEAAGTAEARRVLENLARGTPEAELTQEAKAALGRMDSKHKRSVQ